MLGLKHALLFGLVAISAALKIYNNQSISKRSLELPDEIVIGGVHWTRNEIRDAISSRRRQKPFRNRHLNSRKVFEEYGNDLLEIVLRKPDGIGRTSHFIIFRLMLITNGL